MLLKGRKHQKIKQLDKYFFLVNNLDMQVTIYTVPYCNFSQQEKDYLLGKGIAFIEKNLEENPAYLDEMLKVSNNFAGTPVTVIAKDDGSQVVVKGFNQQEIDAALGGYTGPSLVGNFAAGSDQGSINQQVNNQTTVQTVAQNQDQNVQPAQASAQSDEIAGAGQQTSADTLSDQIMSVLQGQDNSGSSIDEKINQVPSAAVSSQQQNVTQDVSGAINQQQFQAANTQSNDNTAQSAQQSETTQQVEGSTSDSPEASQAGSDLQSLLNKLNSVNQGGSNQPGQVSGSSNQQQQSTAPQATGDLPDFNKNS